MFSTKSSYSTTDAEFVAAELKAAADALSAVETFLFGVQRSRNSGRDVTIDGGGLDDYHVDTAQEIANTAQEVLDLITALTPATDDDDLEMAR